MLRIGNINLDLPVVQAALSGYSDLSMRRVARAYGVPYSLNEVVLDKLVIQRGKKRRMILDVPPDDHPVGGQLMGSNPDDFAPAAEAMAQAGYDVIDINFGCPVKKVLGRCRGGFLLSQPATALEIIRSVYDAVGATHPVSVKMRRGLDDSPESERNFFAILDGAFDIGVAAVTVHGRTVQQRYVGPSQWPFLEKVKRHVGDLTILGSGDLFSAEACVRMLHETGVDGVTVARGCIGNPWIFAECRALLGLANPSSSEPRASARADMPGHSDPPVSPLGKGRGAYAAQDSSRLDGSAGASPSQYLVNVGSVNRSNGSIVDFVRGTLPPPPSIADQRAAIELHLSECVNVHGDKLAPKLMRKFGIKYAEHHPLALQVRDAFIAVDSLHAIRAVLERWYDPAANWPPVCRRDGHGDLIAAGATA